MRRQCRRAADSAVVVRWSDELRTKNDGSAQTLQLVVATRIGRSVSSSFSGVVFPVHAWRLSRLSALVVVFPVHWRLSSGVVIPVYWRLSRPFLASCFPSTGACLVLSGVVFPVYWRLSRLSWRRVSRPRLPVSRRLSRPFWRLPSTGAYPVLSWRRVSLSRPSRPRSALSRHVASHFPCHGVSRLRPAHIVCPVLMASCVTSSFLGYVCPVHGVVRFPSTFGAHSSFVASDSSRRWPRRSLLRCSELRSS